MTCYSEELQIAIKAAEAGGEVIRNNFGRTLEIQTKHEWSEFVTNVDLESESVIVKHLQKACPGYDIISEESSTPIVESELCWFVDPLDGTSNLVLGIPHVSVSIALCDGVDVLVGVVFNPLRSLCYTVGSQDRAAVNGEPLSVSRTKSIDKATIAHIVSYEEKRKPRALELFTHLRSRCYRLLDTWSPSLDWCLLAEGKVDALISLGSSSLDQLAGSLLVRESGGLLTDLRGRKLSDLGDCYLLASNGTELHSELLKIVSQYY